MKVEIVVAGLLLAPTAKADIRRHAYFELSRFADALRRVTVRISKDPTPPLGLQTACRVIVNYPQLGEIEVETRGSDPVQAAYNGVSRIRRGLLRRLRIENRRR